MTEKIRVYQVAKEIGKSERETLKLLEMWQAQRYPRFDDDSVSTTRDAVAGNRLTVVEPEAYAALKRRLERENRANASESRIRPTVVRRTTMRNLPPDPVDMGPIIAITRDMAALLSLTPLTGEERPPGVRFRVEISPPLDGLEAIDVHFRRTTPQWVGEAPTAELGAMFRTIAFGACHLLSAPREATARQRLQPNPVGEREARMREVIRIKIKTRITEAQQAAVSDAIGGRRGYSNVLKESISVRAHWARYHTGPGKAEVTRLWRQAHRRGGNGSKERRYQLRS